ncbi:2-hydroxy-3-oxopropionate reductase [Myceligenerans pegani]|uniref:2-hydroxy-3-oxopropionate reductase n=1 Tax=Myceligenerans pegani TaxID=2776917 RepID=A0ABR9N3Q4_9MICO|nr:2-hydroxy-3-oxopropionate reductase [Myceligenerans sp. TRM 65318]MBE1878299.1 2-hydroxy-3-oxopropionate reductase [Myceligenerans sp. TRM 65318]MBE3020570.1 2-hydroxy-3-oxopropionate reductase [Myceligenerans sp. TRM 65318]
MTGPTTTDPTGKRVAFIGLGIMGAPMAVNLRRAGYDVVGFNRSPGKAEALVAAGGTEAGSVAEAVAGAQIVLTMLPDSPDVEQAVLGDGGIVEHAAAGTLLIDLSTISPDVAREVSRRAAERHVRVLDAPVSGGEQGAVDATLSIMVGGDEGVFQEASPVLSALGTTITYVGPSGSGQTVKAANQLVVAGAIQLVSEALVFLDAQGVDLEAGTRVLQGGLAGSTVLERKGPAMLRREFQPGFRIDLHHKDLGIYTSAARDAGVASPLGQALAGLMGSARAQGLGSLDHSALFLQTERLSGRAAEQ